MSEPCSNRDCSWAVSRVCIRHAELALGQTCPDLGGVPDEEAVAGSSNFDTETPQYPLELGADPPPNDTRFWFGTALGIAEADEQAWRPDTRVFLVAGDKKSGKTCLLVGAWVSLANRLSATRWRFAGSRTLVQWGRLGDAAFAWNDAQTRILPRTNLSNHRAASFLHLDLSADQGNRITSMLLTDFPGEWFEQWVDDSCNVSDRLDFLPRVDGACLVIDVAKVMSDKVYADRLTLHFRRLEEALPGKPIAIALTKVDTLPGEVPSGDLVGIPEAWTGKLHKRLGPLLRQVQWRRRQSRVFATAAFPGPLDEATPLNALDPLLWLLDKTAALATPSVRPTARPVTDGPVDYFACFRDRIPE